jgi:ABC-type transport system substrate-binding protein
MYFLGWKCELGDAGDFFNNIIHSRSGTDLGQFNGNNYGSDEADNLIEKSAINIDSKSRLKQLQQIMTIVTEDVVGVPLFESDTIFAYQKGIEFEPRVDGYMHADEIIIKNNALN